MRLPSPARRRLLAALVALAAPVAGFLVARPAVERAVRARIGRETGALGLSATIGSCRLTPRLSLELREIVVEAPGRVRVRARSAAISPRLSLLGVVGRAASVATSGVLADLPGGVRLELTPAQWVVESGWRDRRVALDGRGETLEITVARDSGARRVEARANGLRLSERLRVLLHGCPVASLGTIDGTARVERDAAGEVRVATSARARGLALVSLDEVDEGCADAALGAPTDVELQAEAVVRPATGSLRAERVLVAAGGAEASLRLAVDGGFERPVVDLEVDVPRVDFARLLATAGLDLPADDLGSATLAARLRGPLLEPADLRVTQAIDFTPPARPLPAIERLLGPFVHTVWSRDGRAYEISVSPESPDFVPLEEVPPLLLRALLIAEDAGFYGHPGIDLSELPLAVATNLRLGTAARGGSTIPQQLAKNLFLSREKTYARKVREALVTVGLESGLSKERLLEIYLNIIEWGPGIYGIEPAARAYFGKGARELTPRQAVYLASIIPSPVRHYTHRERSQTPEWALQLDTVLRTMAERGQLSPESYAEAVASAVTFSTLPVQ